MKRSANAAASQRSAVLPCNFSLSFRQAAFAEIDQRLLLPLLYVTFLLTNLARTLLLLATLFLSLYDTLANFFFAIRAF
jgi:hypothetical protein